MILKVEKILPSFKALSHTKEGKVILFDGALLDEEVEVDLIESKKDYDNARLVKVLKESPYRIKPCCPYFNLCGSCSLLFMTEKAEQDYKRIFFEHFFNKKDFPNISLQKPYLSNRPSSRLRAIFNCDEKKIGYYKKNSHSIVEIKNCFLLEPFLNSKLESTRLEDFVNSKIKEIKFLSFDKEITKNSGLINIADISYFADNSSFFQSNRACAKSMLDFVIENLGTSKNILDLYAGVGFFSKAIEQYSKISQIIAVEENPNCKSSAYKNLKRTKYLNISLENAYFSLRSKSYDLAIIDPVRAGMSKKALEVLSCLNIKRIIYFSCQIDSSIKDIKYLQNVLHYKAIKAKLFNMNPANEHFETACLLEKF